MPPRSKVEGLPKAVKEWLNSALVEGNFAGYTALSAELKSRGHDISKTGLHRYGQAFEERLQALKLVTEQARAVVAAAPDEDDAVNQALVRITQEKLFSLMMDLEIDPKTVDIAKITKSIADLARSSINVKKFRVEVEAETRKRIRQEQNDKLESGIKARGMGPEMAEWLRREVLGMA
jgi:Protein of unknown function (DUF3486)